jgi:ketosteroid isomerase-like protein
MAIAAWSQSAKTDGSTERAITALEDKWTQAQKTNNADAAAPLLAGKFVNITIEGKITSRTEFLAEQKATKYDSVTFDDVKVIAVGSTAVATGIFTAKGTDGSGKPIDVHERSTDTWAKMPNGQWQCVASVSTPLKM